MSSPSASLLPVPPARGAGSRTALVIGASSGIGRALVLQLVRKGYRVAAVARRAAELDKLREECARQAPTGSGALLTLAHDAARAEEVPAHFEALVRQLGGLELLVYAAGIMPKIGRDEYDTPTDLSILRVNLEGAVAWINPAANLMRTQRQGTIVGISSIAGDRGRKGNPVYCTSKAALNTYLEALRNRLAESGVHVCTIKPGFIDTAMTQGMPGLFWLISAETAASSILAAARARVNTRYVPKRWWLVGSVIRAIPSFVFKKLNV